MSTSDQPVSDQKQIITDAGDASDGLEFRLYVDENSFCCKFFADELAKYPAVLSQLQIWHVNNLAPEHKISGVPCIVDTQNQHRLWLGSACLDWLKMAVHYSATKIPLKIPMHHVLRSLYTSTSTTTSSSVDITRSSGESSTSSSSDILDSNQEDSEFAEDTKNATTLEISDRHPPQSDTLLSI